MGHRFDRSTGNAQESKLNNDDVNKEEAWSVRSMLLLFVMPLISDLYRASYDNDIDERKEGEKNHQSRPPL